MKHKKYFIITLMIMMISMWALVPPMRIAKAIGTITNASVTLSDSDTYASSSMTFSFSTATNTPQTGFWRIEIPVGANNYDLSNVDNNSVVCAYGDATFTASTTDSATTGWVECVRSSGGTLAATNTQIIVYNVVNPDTVGVQYITIGNYDNIDVYNERVKIASFIIDDVIVTATVDSSLAFTISATTTPIFDVGVGNYACNDNNGGATATSVPFGTLAVDDPDNICQELDVTTNAQDGYIVTLQQDHELLSDSGATIDSFREAGAGGGTTTPEAWVQPSNTLDYYNTYGHMGISTDDDDIIAGSGLEDFSNGSLFAGLAGTALTTVMDHDGPSDGLTPDKGVATIMFRAHIRSLQEAGDYQATLTYICTPTF